MSQNIVFEGWLTKVPPTKRLWRSKWRRRWFALRQSGELPGQYFLDYYADRNCRRLKGTINLDYCEQVDAGLDRTGNGTLDPKIRGCVFTIQTQSRTYHLEADCEAEMGKWVDAICRVCGFRATDENEPEETFHNTYAVRVLATPINPPPGQGPYIPISECITGDKKGDQTFKFDSKSLKKLSESEARALANLRIFERANKFGTHAIYNNQPRYRTPEISENESANSEDDRDGSKKMNKISSNDEGVPQDGPPVPPRPPKTLAGRDGELEWRRGRRRMSQGALSSPGHLWSPNMHFPDEEEDSPLHVSLQYYNLPVPPAVDRNLKPRTSSTHNLVSKSNHRVNLEMERNSPRPVALQYLDLDLACKTSPKTVNDRTHIKSFKRSEDANEDCAYKTVDFLKTEAFNITRQDAELSRSTQH